MEELVNKFIKSSIELANDILQKELINEKEVKFIEDLNKICEVNNNTQH